MSDGAEWPEHDQRKAGAPGALWSETQGFWISPVWRAFVVAYSTMMIGLFGYGIYVQIIMGRPWGNHPMSNVALILVGLLVSCLAVGLLLLFRFARLITEVRKDGLYLKYIPFHRKFLRLDWNEIKSFKACQYRPLRDYGGWGIRYGRGGKAYNVRGSRGVFFQLANGKTLLVGSQEAEKLAAEIRKASGR